MKEVWSLVRRRRKLHAGSGTTVAHKKSICVPASGATRFTDRRNGTGTLPMLLIPGLLYLDVLCDRFYSMLQSFAAYTSGFARGLMTTPGLTMTLGFVPSWKISFVLNSGPRGRRSVDS